MSKHTASIFHRRNRRVNSSSNKLSKNDSNRMVFLFIFVTFIASLLMIALGNYFRWKEHKDFSLGETFVSIGLNALNSSIFVLLIDIVYERINRDLVPVEEGISYKQIIDKIKEAKKDVVILTLFFGPITRAVDDTKNANEVSESENMKNLNTIKNCIKNNPELSFVIMIMDPNSSVAQQRDKDLAHLGYHVIDVIYQSLYELYELRFDDVNFNSTAKIIIEIYNHIPPFFYIKCDSKISVVHFPPTESFTDGHRIDCKARSKIGTNFMRIANSFAVATAESSKDVRPKIEDHLHRIVEFTSNSLTESSRVPYLDDINKSVTNAPRAVLLLFQKQRDRHLNLFKTFKSNSERPEGFYIKLRSTSQKSANARYKIRACSETFHGNEEHFNAAKVKYGVSFDCHILLEEVS